MITIPISLKFLKTKSPKILNEIALSKLQGDSSPQEPNLSPGQWISLVRKTLRMTQADLAKRANITRANLVAIELGKADPRVSTLRRIYQGLSCNLQVAPHPQKPIEKILRVRARAIAQKRLEEEMGTLGPEDSPDKKMVKKLLKKRTEEVLHDPRERLWREDQNK